MNSNCLKANSYIVISGLLMALCFICKSFNLFPDFVEGFIMGINLVFYALGYSLASPYYSKNCQSNKAYDYCQKPK